MLAQPVVYFGFDDRAFVIGAVAFAVDDAHAFTLAGMGVMEELQELLLGIAGVEPVQVQFAGDAVLAGAQLADDAVLQARAVITEHVAGLQLHRVVFVGEHVFQHLALILQGLDGNGWRFCAIMYRMVGGP